MKSEEAIRSRMDEMVTRKQILGTKPGTKEPELQHSIIRMEGIINALEWMLDQDPEDKCFTLTESEIEEGTRALFVVPSKSERSDK